MFNLTWTRKNATQASEKFSEDGMGNSSVKSLLDSKGSLPSI